MLTIKENISRVAFKLAYQYERQDLFDFLAADMSKNTICFYNERGRICTGWLESITREDGSGYCFNLNIRTNIGRNITIFHRCPTTH